MIPMTRIEDLKLENNPTAYFTKKQLNFAEMWRSREPLCTVQQMKNYLFP